MNDPNPPSEFEPPAESAETTPFVDAGGGGQHLPGGRAPEIGALFSETLADFTENIVPYLMAALGQLVAIVPLILATVFGMYVLIFGFVGLVMVVMFAAIAALGEEAGVVVMVIMELLMFVGIMVLSVGLGVFMTAVTAPINASIARAVAAHQRGDAELEFSAAFSTLTRDVGKVVGVGILIGLATLLGAMMCYVPALLVIFFCGFATSLVALHRMSPIEAIKANIAHVMANLNFHLVFAAVYLGIFMVSAYIPIIGPMFAYSFHVRAYRELFGDGEEPVLELEAA